jgi:hypothetical protein
MRRALWAEGEPPPMTSTTAVAAENLSTRFGTLRTRALVLLLFVVLTLGMTYPLVINLATAVPGPPWDNFVWLYDLWYFRHSIVDLGQWPSFNPRIFYPFGYDLRLSETMYANKLLIALVLFLGGEVLAYNVLLLLGFVLTGYATYLLIAYLTDNRWAAVIGAAAFAFCPFRIHSMAAGWLPLLSMQWIPWTFLYLERALREHKARYAVAAGVFMALNILSSWYYIYVVGAFVGLYLVVRLWQLWRDEGRRVKDEMGEAQRPSRLRFILHPSSFILWLRTVVIFGVVMGVLVAPVAWPVLTNRSGQMSWSLVEVEKWAASADDFLLPNVYHPLWGEFFLSLRAYTRRYPWYAPGFVYLGLVTLVLAVRGLWGGKGQNDLKAPLAWIGGASLVLALGLVLHWQNAVVEIRVPYAIERFMIRGMSTLMRKWALNKASYFDFIFRSGTIPIPLPALLMYLFLPLGSAMRTLYRFGSITMFAVSILAGYGAAHWLGGSRPPRLGEAVPLAPKAAGRRVGQTVLAVALLALVLLDFCSAPLPFGMAGIAPQELDHWLAAQPHNTIVMQFPLTRSLSGNALYHTKYHDLLTTYGHGTFYPQGYQNSIGTLATFPSEQAILLLKGWKVRYVIVGSGAYDANWGDKSGQTWDAVRRAIAATPDLRLVTTIEETPFWRDEWVSEVVYGSAPVVPALTDRLFIYELRGDE